MSQTTFPTPAQKTSISDKNDSDWNYTGPKDTTMWPLHFPCASGSRQSPVNLISRNAVYDQTLGDTPLNIRYQNHNWSLSNMGNMLRSFLINDTESYFGGGMPNSSDAKSVISGGPLPADHTFELAEIQFHWGRNSSRGSEHTVNNKAFPMELHLVHWNTTLYRNLSAATGRKFGIAIIALFVQEGLDHDELHLYIENLHEVQYKDRRHVISSFDPNCLLPDPSLRDYWTYEGSLTTPPCAENVIWILFRYPLMLSHKQMEEFRRLFTYPKGSTPPAGVEPNLVDNFRPVQPLNGRTIRASFPI